MFVIVCRNLKYNDIAEIPDLTFDGNHQLIDLVMSHNRLHHVTRDSFVGLENLQYL